MDERGLARVFHELSYRLCKLEMTTCKTYEKDIPEVDRVELKLDEGTIWFENGDFIKVSERPIIEKGKQDGS